MLNFLPRCYMSTLSRFRPMHTLLLIIPIVVIKYTKPILLRPRTTQTVILHCILLLQMLEFICLWVTSNLLFEAIVVLVSRIPNILIEVVDNYVHDGNAQRQSFTIGHMNIWYINLSYYGVRTLHVITT